MDYYKAILLYDRTRASEIEKYIIAFVVTQSVLRSIKYVTLMIIYILSELNLNVISLIWMTFIIHILNQDYMRRYLKRQTPLTPSELGAGTPELEHHNVHDFHHNNNFDIPDYLTVHEN